MAPAIYESARRVGVYVNPFSSYMHTFRSCKCAWTTTWSITMAISRQMYSIILLARRRSFSLPQLSSYAPFLQGWILLVKWYVRVQIGSSANRVTGIKGIRSRFWPGFKCRSQKDDELLENASRFRVGTQWLHCLFYSDFPMHSFENFSRPWWFSAYSLSLLPFH